MPIEKRIVVHVLSGLAFGGNENLCLQVIHHSPEAVEPILFNIKPSCTDMLPLFRQVANLNYRELAYSRRGRLSFIMRFARELRSLRPSAVCIYVFGIHVFVGAGARLAGVPVIQVHAGNPPPPGIAMRRKWRQIISISRILRTPIQTCSKSVYASLKTLKRELPKGSGVIANGCDVEAIYARATRARANRDNHVKVIGMVARLNPIKAHSVLIEAFRLVCLRQQNVQLWLIGDGELRSRLEAQVKEAGLDRAVVFWGDREDVPELLGQMDVCAFSTTSAEGFGIALAEAMAAKLPIIASDVPACREVLGGGAGGILVPAGDSQLLASTLERLLTSEQERIHWANRAYEHVCAHYSIKRCAEQWYGALLKSN